MKTNLQQYAICIKVANDFGLIYDFKGQNPKAVEKALNNEPLANEHVGMFYKEVQHAKIALWDAVNEKGTLTAVEVETKLNEYGYYN